MRMMVLTLLAMAILSPPAASQDCIDYGDYLHWVSGVDTPGIAGSVVLSGNYAYVADGSAGIQVIDATVPTQLELVGGLESLDSANDVVISGNYAYVADGVAGLQVIDVTDPAHLVRIGGVETVDSAWEVVVSEDHAYVLVGGFGLQVIDISSPASPRIAGSMETPGTARDLALSGNYAYVADGFAGLQVIDVSSPASPQIVGGIDALRCYTTLTRDFNVVAIAGNYAFVGYWGVAGYAGCGGGILVLDISNPASPEIVGDPITHDSRWWASSVTISGNYAYIGSGDHFGNYFMIYDIGDPEHPQLVASVRERLSGVAFTGRYAYVANGTGVQVFDVTNPELASEVGSTWVNAGVPGFCDMAVSGDHAYVAAGSGGLLEVIDISNPATPRWVGELRQWEYTAQGVAISGDYACVVGSYVLRMIDVSVPENPRVVGSTATPDAGSGVAVSGDYAYAVGGYGLRVVDISDAADPQLVGGLPTADYAYEVAISGGYAYVAGDSVGLQVIDITDPLAPTFIGSVEIPGERLRIAISGNYAYVASADDDLQVIDISVPDAPSIVGSAYTPAGRDYWTSPARGVAISGNYAYVGSRSGLDVFDIADPVKPWCVGRLQAAISQATGVAIADGYAYVAGGACFDNHGIFSCSCTFVVARLQCDNTALDAMIDIQPGNAQNPINCKGNPGVIPVAVLTTDTFDALTVDHTTVRFGPGEAAEAHVFKGPEPRGNGASSSRPASGTPRRHEVDVDHDGDLDLLFHFARDETGIRCGDTEVVLTGQTYDGQAIMGTDAIRTVPGGDTDLEPEGQFQVSPNPFNPSTTISFVVREPQRVKIGVYDLRGRLVAELADEPYPAGSHAVEWRGRDGAGRAVPSGTYFFRVDLGGQVAVRKALLIK